jgi:hypothetical protein
MEPAPFWPFITSPETDENFDDILEWTPEEENELMKILDGENGNAEVC